MTTSTGTVPPLTRLAGWLVTIATAVLLGGYHAGVLRIRALLVGTLTIGIVIVWRTLRHGPHTHRPMVGAVGVAALALMGLTHALGDSPYEWLPQCAQLILGWAWLAVALQTTSQAAPPQPALTAGRDWYAALGFAAALTIGGELAFSSAVPRIVDESWFLMQGDLLAHGQLTGVYPVGLESMYGIPLGRFVDGAFTSQYPLGWPALLAIPVRLGIERWVPPLLGLLAAFGAGLLARRVAGPAAGVLAVVLTAGSPMFATGSWTFFSQVVSGTLIVLSALTLERSLSPESEPRGWYWPAVVTGLLGGLLFAVRPLTGMAFGLAAFIRVVIDPIGRRRLPGWLALGFSIPAALLFTGNAQLYDSWHRFGYEYVNGPLASLGFGDRGYLKWMPGGVFGPEIFHFVPLKGAGYVGAGALAVLASFLPVAVLIPLLASRRDRAVSTPVHWWLGAIGLLILAHGFWFYRSTRFFEDAIPLLATAASVLVSTLPGWSASSRRWTAQLALIGLASVAGMGELDRSWSRDAHQTVDEILTASQTQRVVVLVEGERDRDAALQALFPLNGPRYAGRIAIVRDVGVAPDSVRRLFPKHRILRLRCEPCDAQRRSLHPKPRLEPVDAPAVESSR